MKTSFRLGKLKIRNRIIRSAMQEGMIDKTSIKNGIIQGSYTKIHVNSIKEGVGMTTTGAILVNNGIGKIDIEKSKDEYKKMVKSIHELDGLVCAQLAYVALSKITNKKEEELMKIIEDIEKYALFFQNIGFDAVELHYSLSSPFIIERYNKRKDKFGGSRENRVRFTKTIIERLRKVLGKDFPIIVKFSVDKEHISLPMMFFNNVMQKFFSSWSERKGMTTADLTFFSKEFERAGASAIISYRPGYFQTLKNIKEAEICKNSVEIPVIYSGGVLSKESIDEVLEKHNFDFVMLGRALQFNNNILMEPKKDEIKL